jgi:hypothetical protein
MDHLHSRRKPSGAGLSVRSIVNFVPRDNQRENLTQIVVL